MRPILVTGGARGFGAQVCRELAFRGHDIVVHYHKSDKQATVVVQECEQLGVQVDKIQGDFSTILSLEAFTQRYLHRFSQTKGIVNNVGNYLIASPSKTRIEELLALFQTNFFAAIFLIQAFLPSLKKQKGSVVNIGTSGLSTGRPLMHATAYGATKSTLLFYTRSLAKELAADNVNVNMVSPGFLRTAVDLDQAPTLPMKRAATLEETAGIVAFFFDRKNSYITGQNIEVAGGFGL